MLRRLLPRESDFFEYFDEHSRLTTSAAKELIVLVAEPARIAEQVKKIKDLEHQADLAVHRCLEKLHRTFITPIDRNDIHGLIQAMDDVIDLIDGTARKIQLFELTRMPDSMREAADVLLRSVQLVEHAVNNLRRMKDGAAILADCVEIKRCETEADAIHAAAVARLFKEEKDTLAIIKWREIYEGLESATDACEDAANIVEGIVLEHA